MKKRFELFEEELEYWIHDHETKKNYGTCDLDCLEDLLNEQDEKIKEQEKVILNNNQKLADNYYEKLNELDEKYNIDLDKRLKEIEKLKQENQQLQQSQNQKAIEELEKVRKFYNSNSDCDWVIDCCELDKYINNQIAELRGKENEKA